MKASDMTNEELVSWVERIASAGNVCLLTEYRNYLREAAARLRLKQRSDDYAAALCSHEGKYKLEICDLRRRLKVAEDSLVESKVAVCHTCDKKYICGHGTDKFDPCCVYKDIDNALFEIREEGGAKISRMRQLLAFYKLGIDKDIADLRKERGGLSKVSFVKIIENLVAGDRARAAAYAELMIQNAERRYRETKDIFDKYDIMTAKNVLHTLKGEPKEGGIAVLDTLKGTNDERKSVYSADEIRRVADRMEQSGVAKEIYLMVGNSLANDEYHGEDIVAILRQGIRDSETAARRGKHLNLILQKALELGVDVPLGLRKVIDEVIVEEDKAVGLGVFSSKTGDQTSDGAVPETPKVVLQEIKDEAGIAKVKEIFFDIFPEERPRGDEAFDCYRESIQPEMLTGERLTYYLVRGEDGEIVGLTGIYSCIVHTAWLGWYGVVPSKRKRGYGHAILGSTLDAMRSMGYKFARLYTDPNVNADAQPVYKSFGFVLDSVYEDGNTAIATMKLGLSNGGETPPDWEGRPYGY